MIVAERLETFVVDSGFVDSSWFDHDII